MNELYGNMRQLQEWGVPVMKRKGGIGMVRSAVYTLQDCCKARHVKKFLTSGLEACLLSLSLAPARQHIFHSVFSTGRGSMGAEVEGGASGCCVVLGCKGRAGRDLPDRPTDVHEIWLSVFLKVLRP